MVKHAPFVVVLLYITVSMLIFWVGPMPWPVTNTLELVIFQLAALFLLIVGYLSAATKNISNRHSVNIRPFFLIGVVGVIALQIPLTLTYTGKYPWEVFSAITDQRLVYEEMLEQLVATQGERFYVPLLRSIVMPLYFFSIGYGLLNFRSLSLFQKSLLVIGLLCPINLSLLRGTDKEIADFIIIVCGFLLISYCRKVVDVRERHAFVYFSFSRVIAISLVVVSVFFMFFSYRKLERLGGDINFCVGEGFTCADYSGPFISLLPDFIAFGYAMISAYLTNGYYGLSLALDLPFESTYGIGHSSALLSLYERISGSTDLFDRTYIAKVSESGWSHRYYWSSFYTWLANDIHFIGALFVVALLARWFRQAWRDAVYARNDLAAVMFVLICITFLYLPANNQIGQTFDSYFAFIGTLICWKLSCWRRVHWRGAKFEAGS